MSVGAVEFNRRAVRPIQCYREAWQLIKDDYWLFLGITLVGATIARAFAPVLMGPMWCGIDYCMLRRMRGRQVLFSHLFQGFDFFGPSVVATLLALGINFVLVMCVIVAYFAALITLGLFQERQGGPPDAPFILMFLGIIFVYVVAITLVSLTLYAPCLFMYGLIVERKMSGVEAFTTSIRAIFANFWGVAGVLLLYLLLVYAGLLMFLVGAWFVHPIYYAAFAVAYRQVFPRADWDAADLVDEDDEDENEREHAPRMVEGPASTGIQTTPPRDVPPETGITAE
jgi:hypothetical protein